MSEKVLTYITGIIISITILGFFLWIYNVEANADGNIPYEGNETYFYLFLGLCIAGLITGSISLKATNEKGDKISKKTILSGLAFAVMFFLWRLSVSL
ncbi:hypothetical protein [Mesobacillus jeotgali]|uniref:hypothetical protein n=1 Tax=Mesobacillus jeotgali TaxID=129985 RepID=UPI0009A5F6D3|nr:hypothetical protein [Mesobacillus jeotgali]